jgi:transcription antitermination factor NusG
MAEWIVAHVLANAEQAVAERLRTLGVFSYFPKYRQQVCDRRTHRKRWKEKALFPGYLFIRSKLRPMFLEINEIFAFLPGMSSKLDHAIETLIASEINGFVALPEVKVVSRFNRGDPVRVISGLFRGHKGKCARVVGQRANVQFDMLGRKVGIWYSEGDLAAA